MCRLLYVNSKEEFCIVDYLYKFAEMSRKSKEYQGHGWGCAYLHNGNWCFYKNINPIWEDNLKQFGNTKLLIAHARSAFRDEGISIENNMPFNDDKYIFIFNGELRGVKIKEKGRIGAEKIFNYIKRFDKGNFSDAIKRGTEIIIKKTTYIRAMNFIITDASNVYLYSYFNEEPDYFTMYKKISDDLILICSEKLNDELDWQTIPNNTLMELKCI